MVDVIIDSQFESCELDQWDDDDVEDSSDSCGEFDEALDDDLVDEDDEEEEEEEE
jgi:hypothetical protein